MKKFFLRVSYWKPGLSEAADELRAGMHRHDVLERCVRGVETDPLLDSVGYGAAPNIMGEMELDAAFMDGDTRRLGCVAGVKSFLPVRIARLLMEEPEFHTFIAGEGAELFAREKGLMPDPVLSDAQRAAWEKKVRPLLEKRDKTPLADIVRQLAKPRDTENRDTVVMIASDGKGLSAASSTSGWGYKFPGRIGDTPVAGAGFYVDTRYGGAACTHTGEMSTRASSARYIVAQMERGLSPTKALEAAANDLAALREGVLRTLVLHAVNAHGEADCVVINPTEAIEYQYWNEDMKQPESRPARAAKVAFRSFSCRE
jgi:L-asparaginase